MKDKQSLTTTARQCWLDCALEDLTEGRSPAEVLEGMIDELQEHKRALAKGEQDTAEFITDRRTLTAILSEATKLHAEKAKDNWRAHFESAGEIEAGPPVWLIENWLMKGTTMALSGLPESYKTFVALNLCRALLTCEPLFGRLAVGEKADILYLIPKNVPQHVLCSSKADAGKFEEGFESDP
jgi:RecA-family ATPase